MLKLFRVALERSGRRWSSGASARKGLVLGVYTDECGELRGTEAFKKFDEKLSGLMTGQLKGRIPKVGKTVLFNNVSEEYQVVVVAGAGYEDAGYNSVELIDECKENVRIAAGAGAAAVQDFGVGVCAVEGFNNAEAAAEGALLSTWRYQDLKDPESRIPVPKIELYSEGSPDAEGFKRGVVKADAQNTARKLEEAPGNIMTPQIFAQSAFDIVCPCGAEAKIRYRDWMESKRMNCLLSVARGSCEAPVFLEVGWCGAKQSDKPVVIVGKGVTFDTGGLCLKKPKKMEAYRAAMSGAAVAVGTVKAAAMMNLPINVQGLIPLCENMIGGMAMKPGDVFMSQRGKTIRIENTDNEGRVILADALCYAADFKPCLIISVGSESKATKKLLGYPASAAFVNSDNVWRELVRAAADVGDRFWRMPPFWKYYTHKVTDYVGVDVNNVGKGLGGDPCLAAAFLHEFIPPETDFLHIDISGSGMVALGPDSPYLKKGSMTGRPVRALAQLMYQIACPHDRQDCPT